MTDGAEFFILFPPEFLGPATAQVIILSHNFLSHNRFLGNCGKHEKHCQSQEKDNPELLLLRFESGSPGTLRVSFSALTPLIG